MKNKKNIGIIILASVIILMMILSFSKVIEDSLGMSIAFILFLVFTLLIRSNAKKNDVKLIEYIMTAFAILTLVILVFSVRAFVIKHTYPTFKFQVIVEKNNSDKSLMFNYNNHNYYSYNLSDVSVIMEKSQEKLSLQEALINGQVTLEEVLSLAAKDTDTVGYEIYYDAGQKKYKNDEYSIVVCDNDTNDIIFSTFDYKFTSEICK